MESDEKVHFGYRLVSEQEKGRLVHRHFESIASKYDFMNSLLSFGVHLLWKRRTIRMLGLKPGQQVLDVCGGTGDLSILAARQVGASGRVVLYDINRAMMKTGRAKVVWKGLRGRVRFVQGDAERISLRGERFDAALVGFGIRNLTHMEDGFVEMFRALKPGGKIGCLEFSRPVTPWFRWLYDLYSFHIMPAVGKALAGSRQAYTYLPESIRLFPTADELAGILVRIGFRHVRHFRMTDGIAALHIGLKPQESGPSDLKGRVSR
jgi:demethylmenaquinone methyltransferase/2-methoxy-6-polyprenyl-1,4-benzoquinol methylase